MDTQSYEKNPVLFAILPICIPHEHSDLFIK